MYFDFLNILTLVTIFAGVICLVDIILRARQRKKSRSSQEKIKHPLIIEYARAFFPVLLIVLLIRTFLFQPYRVPTGSLEPTIIPGDMIFVNQYDYGLRVPLWNYKFINIDKPKTGQIALFRWPVNPAITFVKRVIGTPGDRISYIDKVLYINGKKQPQKFVSDSLEIGDNGQTWKVKKYEEDLKGLKHFIIIRPDQPAKNFKNLVVPKGKYFMMGDNRDDSDDSRSWGFVPEKKFIGKALFVFMSWDSQKHRFRWDRIGKSLSSESPSSGK